MEFQSTGDIISRSLQPDTVNGDATCPETHFWCIEKNICLPVFVRCNGVYDCPGHEDEEDCDLYTCPGYYRCRGSKVCVHLTHVCDDWSLCPQLDDELLCDQTCPMQCICHGLAFFCRQVIAAGEYLDLRYLDARGSGMTVHQLSGNHMLIHLSLGKCGINSADNLIFPNLHSLDLSDNLLTEVSCHHLRHVPQLTVLFLAGNPLTSVFVVSSGSNCLSRNMEILDLSRVKTPLVVPSLHSAFSSLKSLNLSHSHMDLWQWDTLDLPVPSLQELDLRGIVISKFPRDVLRRFLHLQILFTDSFTLCCPVMLRPGFDLNHCHTAPDDVSSCDNLLGSVTYRATVAVLAILSLLGNVVSLTVRVCVGRMWRQSSGGVVLTHLSVADLGTGLYLATLGLADRLLAGQYVWQDDTWRRGVVCHLAGVLALSCRHGSTFFITILSFDRCLHRLPTLDPYMTSAKATVVCVVVWAASLILVAFPVISGRLFFGQQTLCVPLPHAMDDSMESRYALGVMVIGNLIMFSLCCVCETISNLPSRGTISTFGNKNNSFDELKFVILGSVASGFLFAIASLVPTDSHSDSQRAKHQTLVYFAFVVSCAMNPYLHLYGVRMKHRKQIKEERLLKIVNRSCV